MQLYAKFLAIFHRKAIQATAAEAEDQREGAPKDRGEEKAMTTMILIVLLSLLTRLIHLHRG